MTNIGLPPSALPADLPREVRLQIVSRPPEIPDGIATIKYFGRYKAGGIRDVVLLSVH